MSTPPITRAKFYGQVTLEDAAVAEIEKARAEGNLGDGTRTEPRCHVCCEAESRELVNKLIAAGLTNREITESCGPLNARRQDKGDDRLIDSRKVWQHRRNHFNIDAPIAGVLRDIMERRAEEANRDHVNGIGHAVTPYAVLETLMYRGYQAYANVEAEPPSIRETMSAAVKIHELTAADAGQRKMADMMHMMTRIIDAAERYVAPEDVPAFLAEVEGRKPMTVLSEKVIEVAQEAIKEFTPPRTMDEDDLI